MKPIGLFLHFNSFGIIGRYESISLNEKNISKDVYCGVKVLPQDDRVLPVFCEVIFTWQVSLVREVNCGMLEHLLVRSHYGNVK